MDNLGSASRLAPRLNRNFSLYHQIEAILLEQIVTGEFAPGTQLPTEKELCDLYHVSRPTVRQALVGLENQNLVRREQGRGTFVLEPVRRDRMALEKVALSRLLEPEKLTRIALQRTGVIRGHGDVHANLGLPKDAEIFYFVRIFIMGTTPIGAAKVHLPIAFSDRLTKSDMIAGDVHQMLEERCGFRFGTTDCGVGAVLAQPFYAEMLGCQTGVPLIHARRTGLGGDQRPLEHTELLFRTDRCEIIP